MDVRQELARIVGLDRPWQLLAGRQALAGAVVAGTALSGRWVDLTVASAVVDRRAARASPLALATAVGWHDVLQLLAAVADPGRGSAVDGGLLRTLHWLLHRHLPQVAAGRTGPGADLRLPAAAPGGDAVDAAVWTAAAVRRAEPFPFGTAAVAHAVELLLLAEADGLPPWYAGRASPAGDPREVLQAAAEVHLDRCREGEQRWFAVARLLAGAGLQDRMTGPCWDAAAGLPLTNTSYRSAATLVRRRPVTEQQASRDLKALVDAGLLHATGRTRDRTYRWAA